MENDLVADRLVSFLEAIFKSVKSNVHGGDNLLINDLLQIFCTHLQPYILGNFEIGDRIPPQRLPELQVYVKSFACALISREMVNQGFEIVVDKLSLHIQSEIRKHSTMKSLAPRCIEIIGIHMKDIVEWIIPMESKYQNVNVQKLVNTLLGLSNKFETVSCTENVFDLLDNDMELFREITHLHAPVALPGPSASSAADPSGGSGARVQLDLHDLFDSNNDEDVVAPGLRCSSFSVFGFWEIQRC